MAAEDGLSKTVRIVETASAHHAVAGAPRVAIV
jgi:hypothetical protein